MSKRKQPKLDHAIEHDAASDDDFTDAFKMLPSPALDRPKSENRQPTKAELDQRWKLERR